MLVVGYKTFSGVVAKGCHYREIYAAKLVIKVTELAWYKDCGTCGVLVTLPANSTTTIGPYDVK